MEEKTPENEQSKKTFDPKDSMKIEETSTNGSSQPSQPSNIKLSIGSILESSNDNGDPEYSENGMGNMNMNTLPMATSTPMSYTKQPSEAKYPNSVWERKGVSDQEENTSSVKRQKTLPTQSSGEEEAKYSHPGAPTATSADSISMESRPSNLSTSLSKTTSYPQFQVRQFVSPIISIDNSALEPFLNRYPASESLFPVTEYEYTPWLEFPLLYSSIGKFVRVTIDIKWLNAAINPRLCRREIWGTDVYTDDSDIATILAHCGCFSLLKPVRKIAVVDLYILPPLVHYKGTRKNQIESRSWSSRQDGISLKIKEVTWKPACASIFENSIHTLTLEERLQARLELSRSSTFKI
ncbi:Clr6 and Rpd3L histone deacetylase complex LCCL domain subunit Rxt3 [Schizosaccharomyces pombe]|uniref:Transcriptional regulatory protein rxt3 n=1 Tax=Schizosaccharomyces pombe (strain 972 / ATCC 24843) TaxID=284812 RepID=RXT3_SCHPO|nr:transcriptional regulatory protein Rxt3 [Schizosaccharomyces pombe]O94707.1 RecName: Full=Transcriptional regulatory protein rxt3 [Schizosaccharomyces pombe 972h-]8I03_I Chain I, Transcriptional regulatory protein rxt3 [Schizosaccharomyces pombe]CAA22545.1 transcriptional regulatory protein Rxt3 [Schizosaccharomyces pombe]|eukprot:NP_588063.1 transcriptional regulatory protein Rxt3 [Schizosaccharomyces pombe]